MRVLLIAGGWSSEREVALSGAVNVEAALRRLGHDVARLDPSTEFHRLLDQAATHDFAFLNLHGAPGEDGLIQAMLERAGCPYQGAGPAASFLALHKAAAKEIFRRHQLPTPAWSYLPVDPGPDWRFPHGFPAFVKPNLGGSSLGMGRAETPEALREAVATLHAQGVEVLVEAAAPGTELTCAVLGDEALPVILIRPLKGDYFDYASKYQQGGAEELCPAPIPDAVRQQVQDVALRAHRALGCAGYSRADFMWSGGMGPDDVLLLEVNTLPGMTPTSLLPQAARAAGLDFDALIARLMELGLAEHRKTR